jgi:anti-sigma factor (TIGR02949 family)
MPQGPEDCAAVLPLLEPYLDGELSSAEAEGVREHTARCPACAAELRLAQTIQDGLRALPEIDAPPEVLSRVRKAAEMPAEILPFGWSSLTTSPRRFHLATLAAALILTLLGALLLFQLRSPQAQQPSAAEIARATAEARYALAYVGRASRRAGLEIKDEVLPEHLVAPAARSLSRSLNIEPDPAPRQGS